MREHNGSFAQAIILYALYIWFLGESYAKKDNKIHFDEFDTMYQMQGVSKAMRDSYNLKKWKNIN